MKTHQELLASWQLAMPADLPSQRMAWLSMTLSLILPISWRVWSWVFWSQKSTMGTKFTITVESEFWPIVDSCCTLSSCLRLLGKHFTQTSSSTTRDWLWKLMTNYYWSYNLDNLPHKTPKFEEIEDLGGRGYFAINKLKATNIKIVTKCNGHWSEKLKRLNFWSKV